MLTGFWLLAEVTSLGTNLVREEVARALLQRSQLCVSCESPPRRVATLLSSWKRTRLHGEVPSVLTPPFDLELAFERGPRRDGIYFLQYSLWRSALLRGIGWGD